ncbi:WxcM-like domain-containing protein [Aureimonas glaciei]|jgi:acetyltransferase-like isoleucine patch superfamily enzyme/dTDP-4-dehydrorhamnose 3,5-epimerase-like enzyme|uniref:Isomerase n=1 Tax=Aureimonas glaciei TaxID=1776957 RepID=A0A916XUY1_9HYPH|nr:WxcM-like domain-containing protein [Aureimonas glaciei]GGD14261.1 isomerase [Aureimonas glaciei]
MTTHERAFFVHPSGICESENIGDRTRIWAFAHVLPGAQIGQDCNICDNVFIENDVQLGDGVTVKCGVQVWDGITIGDRVFIGPNATFTNDRFPRSRQYPEVFQKTVVEDDASIGANATILPGLRISRGAMIGAGAVVTRDVPPNAIVVGNPARIVGYSNTKLQADSPVAASGETDLDEAVTELGVGGATLHRLKVVSDMRGSLSVGEFEKDLPFQAKRYFVVYDVPSREVRGEHAHKVCQQFLICLRGSVTVLLDDGKNRTEVLLDRPSRGVHMPAMVWGTQYRYTDDAVLLVFASENYDSNDYIRSYEDFKRATTRD